MPAREKEYRRLPGVGTRGQGLVSVVAIRSRLWLGKDHLLCIDSQGFSEDYKRFYFRDIQAIILRRNAHGKMLNGGVGALGLIAAALGLVLFSAGSMIGAIVSASFAGFFLLVLLINVARGPTGVCHLRTAVQIEELPSLNRVRRARKVLNRIRPLIAEAQGRLDSEEIPVKMRELALAAAPTGADRLPMAAEGSNVPPRIAG